jgi:soluble lytic murein transglycosylase-like protein
MEVQGIVKGCYRVNGKGTVLVEKSDGSTLEVRATEIPDWIEGNEVSARLIIRASRTGELASLNSELIAVAAEDQVREIEDAEKARLAAEKKKRDANLASRKGKERGDTAFPRPSSVPKEWNLPTYEAAPYYAGFIKRENPKLSNNEAFKIANTIIHMSQVYGVDARLVMAIVMAESGFNPNDTSSSGAMGLGQLMPGTAKWMGVNNAYDTYENLYGTVKLIRFHLDDYGKQTNDQFKQLVLTLAAYNAGMGAVKRAGGVPPYRETQNYVRKVINIYKAFCGMK